MLSGMKEPYRKGDSESILASSLADEVARPRLKRRRGYRWAGLLSFEKPVWNGTPTPFREEGGNTSNHDNREWPGRSCVV
jgi:hypothetical protein